MSLSVSIVYELWNLITLEDLTISCHAKRSQLYTKIEYMYIQQQKQTQHNKELNNNQARTTSLLLS